MLVTLQYCMHYCIKEVNWLYSLNLFYLLFQIVFTMNSPFILNFDKFERNQFWKKYPCHVKTVCRISAYLRSVGKNKIIINCQSKNNIEHAEVMALKSIDKKLTDRLIKQCDISTQASGSQKTTEFVFDISVRLNRSPCTNCQKYILKKILEIQKLIPTVNIRFILFFSFLNYSTKSEELTLQKLCQWILAFINRRISVIIGPIIVTKVVPKPRYICIRNSHIKENQNLILQFRKLVNLIQYSLQKQSNDNFTIITHRLFSNENCIKEELRNYSSNNPIYIPIFPKIKHFLSELVPNLSEGNSTNPLNLPHKSKVITERKFIHSRVRTLRISGCGYKNRSRKRKNTNKKKPNV